MWRFGTWCITNSLPRSRQEEAAAPQAVADPQRLGRHLQQQRRLVDAFRHVYQVELPVDMRARWTMGAVKPRPRRQPAKQLFGGIERFVRRCSGAAACRTRRCPTARAAPVPAAARARARPTGLGRRSPPPLKLVERRRVGGLIYFSGLMKSSQIEQIAQWRGSSDS